MKEKITMAVIGLGQRGYGLLTDILLKRTDVKVSAVCDVYPDRVEKAQKAIKESSCENAVGYTDYKLLLTTEKLDAVLISCAWEYHLETTIFALKQGVAVAMEVGGCYSEQELWELVRTQEGTGTPFMFMENCCYNKSEVLATNMARKGLFGTIVHMSGSYSHDLRDEIAGGNTMRHYRLRNYTHRNCDNYPTHDIGPIAKLLKINAGNRFVSLVSVASKAEGLSEYVKDHSDKYPELLDVKFKQGDIVNTLITCANGETIDLKLDTTLPRFYARDFTVRGTKGFYEQNTNLVYLEKDHSGHDWDPVLCYKDMIDSGEQYSEYLPEEWRNLTKEQIESGHGGMDYLEFSEFTECIRTGKELPIDVYDAATWMIISVLSEKSIALGGQVVDFPDFTCGKWIIRKHKDVNMIIE